MLLLIDNCEHLIEAAAHLVECLLRHAPQMHILATSRESLRATGEHIQPLRPLGCPPAQVASIEDALAYPAVALLIERAKETHEEFEFRPEDLPRVGEICRRLEGIPLALELAAGHLGQADGSIDALLQGGYLDLPLQSDRHQHLRAMLDWSYALLRPAEQSCLRRLSVFRGSFTLDSVAAALGQPADLGTAFLLVNHLTAKSLLSTEVRGDEVTYRLLEPTRLYALEKLQATGELHEPGSVIWNSASARCRPRRMSGNGRRPRAGCNATRHGSPMFAPRSTGACTRRSGTPWRSISRPVRHRCGRSCRCCTSTAPT